MWGLSEPRISYVYAYLLRSFDPKSGGSPLLQRSFLPFRVASFGLDFRQGPFTLSTWLLVTLKLVITYLFRVWIERMPFILRVSVLYFWRGVAASSHWLVCIYRLSQLPSWVALCRQFRGMLAYEPGRHWEICVFNASSTSPASEASFHFWWNTARSCFAEPYSSRLETLSNNYSQLQKAPWGQLCRAPWAENAWLRERQLQKAPGGKLSRAPWAENAWLRESQLQKAPGGQLCRAPWAENAWLRE